MVKKQKLSNNLIVSLIGLIVIALSITGVVMAYSGGNPTTVFEGDCVDCILESSGGLGFGAVTFADGDVTNLTDLDISDEFRVQGEASLATTTVRRFTQGIGFFATNTAETSATLSEYHLLNYNGIAANLTGGTMTYTLPATSTLTTFIPNVGDTASWFIMPTGNALTLAAGTGILLRTASSTGSIDLTVDVDDIAELVFTRATGTGVWAMLNEFSN